MTITVDYVFDFASPNAYLCHKVLPQIAARTGATFRYVPCLLGGIFKATGNQAPMLAFANVQGKLAYEQLEIARFISAHGLTAFRFNPHFPVNTLTLMRAAVAAQDAGVFPAFLEAGFAAMWEEGLKMDDPDVFTATLSRAGLDGAGLLARTQDPEIKAKLIAHTQEAVARGAFGVPTFFVGDEMYFGKERLGQIEAQIKAQIEAETGA